MARNRYVRCDNACCDAQHGAVTNEFVGLVTEPSVICPQCGCVGVEVVREIADGSVGPFFISSSPHEKSAPAADTATPDRDSYGSFGGNT